MNRTTEQLTAMTADRTPIQPLDHPQTVNELVAWLDAHPGLQVCYLRFGA